MNDKEYILAGVELADGWHTLENAVGFLEVVKTYHGFGGPDSDKEIIAALAAQLIEQMDTTGYHVEVFSHSTMIFHGGHEFRTVSNNGRDMNTIKVVVDSKVLKK